MLEDAQDPGPRVASRLEPGRQQVDRLCEQLRSDERRPAHRAERGAVEDVVELSIAQERERPDDDETHRDRGQDDDADERLERLVRRRTDAGREELAQDDTEERPGDGTPGERHEDDADGLVLVDVGRVEVDDEEERDEEGARDERDREVPGRGDRDDHDDPRDERDPERVLVGRWQTREDRRRESHGASGLARVGGVPAYAAGPRAALRRPSRTSAATPRPGTPGTSRARAGAARSRLVSDPEAEEPVGLGRAQLGQVVRVDRHRERRGQRRIDHDPPGLGA